MESARAIAILQSKVDEIDGLVRLRMGGAAFIKWKRDTEVALERIFGTEGRHRTDFANIRYSLGVVFSGMPDSAYHEAYVGGLETARAVLLSIIDEIREFGSAASDETDGDLPRPDPFSLVELICLRFHYVARQLRVRHADRPTLEVDDEYDAQDLFHALLKLHFDDVRPEEWTPSYAGGSSRVDFLLKEEGIIVELKKTRKSMSERDIGEQLITDAARYQAHPDCRALICFVYDPEGRVGNPVGLERDLEALASNIKIRVIIAPKGS
ncbi:hypothetical protein KPL74_08930 [Bacillus sp. NP157]|nr:hypothetical protein KPL74_08930 [Bacillus sp. NP157]